MYTQRAWCRGLTEYSKIQVAAERRALQSAQLRKVNIYRTYCCRVKRLVKRAAKAPIVCEPLTRRSHFPRKRLPYAHLFNTTIVVIPRAARSTLRAAALMRDPPGLNARKKAAALNPLWAPCLRRSMKGAATRARGDAVFKSAELSEYFCECGSASMQSGCARG